MNKQTYLFMGIPFPACVMRTMAGISTGRPVKEVATMLKLSDNTVYSYLRIAYNLLKVRKRCELMALTLSNGFDNRGNYLGQPMLGPASEQEM